MSHTKKIIVAGAIALVAGSTQAALFSFASDTEDTAFTFGGAGASITDAAGAQMVELVIDDNNGPLPELVLDTEFTADFFISHVASVAIFPGLFVHNYSLGGSFLFSDAATGAGILSGFIEVGALTVLGGATSWDSAGSIIGTDDSVNLVGYTWLAESNSDYGLVQNGFSTGPDDGAFTMTFLQSFANATSGIELDAQTLLPSFEWQSEGSFSGTAFAFVPTPASIALIGLGSLAATRRRR